MLKRVAIIISPNWKDYAQKYLADCVEALRGQDYQGETKIYLADNESSEASRAYIKKVASEVELIVNENNDGFAKGNNDCMKPAVAEGFDYIFLINMDAVAAPDCVRRLVEAAELHPDWGAVQPRLMLFSDQEIVNSLGNDTHFLGFGYCRGYLEKWQDRPVQEPIHYPSGAAVLFSRQALEAVGYFNEEYWMYNEDQELGWRLWLAGYKCSLVPAAVAYHKYEFARSVKQYYWMDRNRILSILLCYRLGTLLLIAPAFLVMEGGLALFAWKSGWIKEKFKVWRYFFQIGSWRHILSSRRFNQDLRKIPDRDIIPLISGRIWYQEVDDWKLRLVNPIFSAYWQVCKFIIRW